MKFSFRIGAKRTPAKTCELCLQPMIFLGDHTGRTLFRCEECALVCANDISPQLGLAQRVMARAAELRFR
jgi:hypothetical protein